MSKKSNKKEEVREEKPEYKTTELKNFINVLREVDKDISEDIQKKKPAKSVKTTKEVKEVKEVIREEKPNKGFYLSFNARFLLNGCLLIITIAMFVCSLFLSFGLTKEELITYSVKSNIDYKVYLKPNDFYDTPYLEKGRLYVSSLVDKIKVDYNYKFNISKDSNIDFDYKTIARLVIANKANSNIFFDKEYVLEDTKTNQMINNTNHTISTDTSIDYTYYNSLANKFRSKYAVDTNSYLEVYLLVNEKNSDNNEFKLDNNSKAILTIPLSLQEINISLKEADIDQNNQVVSNAKIVVKNYGNVIISVILLIMLIVLIVKFVKKISLLTNKKSTYDNYITKLLRGYDRIIVNIKTAPNFKENNVIKVESFEELIDVRDNYKVPINYYVITEHQKSEFFCVNNNDVYVYIVKAVDLDKGKKNEKK